MKIRRMIVAVALAAGLAGGSIGAFEGPANAAPTHSRHDTTWGCPGC